MAVLLVATRSQVFSTLDMYLSFLPAGSINSVGVCFSSAQRIAGLVYGPVNSFVGEFFLRQMPQQGRSVG